MFEDNKQQFMTIFWYFFWRGNKQPDVLYQIKGYFAISYNANHISGT